MGTYPRATIWVCPPPPLRGRVGEGAYVRILIAPPCPSPASGGLGGRGPCATSSRHSDSSSRRKFQHRVEQHLGAGVQVLRLGFLAHVVAEPADARHEDHAGGAQ